jgi:hypothetical protein
MLKGLFPTRESRPPVGAMVGSVVGLFGYFFFKNPFFSK